MADRVIDLPALAQLAYMTYRKEMRILEQGLKPAWTKLPVQEQMVWEGVVLSILAQRYAEERYGRKRPVRGRVTG